MRCGPVAEEHLIAVSRVGEREGGEGGGTVPRAVWHAGRQIMSQKLIHHHTGPAPPPPTHTPWVQFYALGEAFDRLGELLVTEQAVAAILLLAGLGLRQLFVGGVGRRGSGGGGRGQREGRRLQLLPGQEGGG